MEKTSLKTCIRLVWLLALYSLAAAQSWEIAGTMPVPVAAGRTFSLDGRIYILGGQTDAAGSPSDLVQIYDPARNLWLTEARLPEGRSGFAAALHGAELLMTGGLTATMDQARRLQGWDRASWRTLREHPWFDRVDGQAVVLGERLILLGGYPVPFSSFAAAAPFIAEYDLGNNSFMYADSTAFPGEAPYQQMAALWSGQIYLFGGVQFGVSSRTWRYDPADHTLVRTLPNLLQPRAGGEAVAASTGDIYLIGGYNESRTALSSVEIIQIHSGFATTAAGPDLRYARRAPMAVEADGILYVFGGFDERGYIPAAIEKLTLRPNTGVQVEPGVACEFNLISAYPNPFNSRTVIAFSLDRPANAEVAIYTMTGARIKTLLAGQLTSGSHRVAWDGTDDQNRLLPSGLYFCRLTASGKVVTQKMTLVR